MKWATLVLGREWWNIYKKIFASPLINADENEKEKNQKKDNYKAFDVTLKHKN